MQKALKKNKAIFPVEIKLSTLSTREGQFVSASIRDITRRKKNEEKIIRLNKELSSLDDSKNEFLRLLNHEIRTPLNGVLGGLYLLKEGVKSEKLRLYVEMLDVSTKRLETFSIKTLAISELRTKGNRCLILANEDLIPIINHSISQLSSKASKRNVSINFNYEENLGTVKVDRKKWKLFLVIFWIMPLYFQIQNQKFK